MEEVFDREWDPERKTLPGRMALRESTLSTPGHFPLITHCLTDSLWVSSLHFPVSVPTASVRPHSGFTHTHTHSHTYCLSNSALILPPFLFFRHFLSFLSNILTHPLCFSVPVSICLSLLYVSWPAGSRLSWLNMWPGNSPPSPIPQQAQRHILSWDWTFPYYYFVYLTNWHYSYIYPPALINYCALPW